ncbi:DUF1826 domain-containing protein [Marinomonas algarum]|uniref:DUF1826 domain-containing protein n=1 Tax=Marinomonas algarum TaxID=2883105 RepID=A0A9X1INR7_9GAMM|nr:DUF1826 domain-containing protein [Marinomonas algarum]MCB5162712.1 DUF1826 domain-containing protein [Marinomonas algarum]
MQASAQNIENSDQVVGLLSVAKSSHQEVLADIYQPNIGMTVWQRSLAECADYAQSLLRLSPNFAYSSQGNADKITALLRRLLPEHQGKDLFLEDIHLLVEMFACLFDLKEVGLRLTALSSAMCPRFHVDKIPCRMVSTYAGTGSEWLHEAHVIRSQLGRGGNVNDHNSGLLHGGVINRLAIGDVAIMKGDEWPMSLGRGMVHRSPAANTEDKRLFLSIDMT